MSTPGSESTTSSFKNHTLRTLLPLCHLLQAVPVGAGGHSAAHERRQDEPL